MKIVQILATSGGVGGLEQHTFNLVNELAKSNEVHIIAHPCYAEKFNINIHFHALDFSRSRWNIILLWQLFCLIKKIQPEIVHAQAGKASELVARIRMFLPQVKLVTTIHGTKKNKSAYLVGDAVIAVSQALTQGIPQEKAYIVYNGVYPQAQLSADAKQKLKHSVGQQFPNLDSSKKIVMCIGRLEPVKNIALLIKAMQRIDANLWIVGEGSLRHILEQQVQQQNMQNRVAFLGFRTDARDLLQIANIVVLSSDREGFPLVMVEALQADKVMASTKVNGVIEWLPESYLASIGDSNELQNAIENALTDKAQQDFEPLFIRAKKELTVEAMAQQTFNIYQKLLKS